MGIGNRQNVHDAGSFLQVPLRMHSAVRTCSFVRSVEHLVPAVSTRNSTDTDGADGAQKQRRFGILLRASACGMIQ